MILLTPVQSALLHTEPEYRMGYHKVHARLSGGGFEFGYILNETIFLQERENPWQMNVSWDYLCVEAGKTNVSIDYFRVIPREPETLRGVRHIAVNREKWHVLAESSANAALSTSGSAREQLLANSAAYAAKSTGAKDAPITVTSAGDIFKRYSAYVNDRRVTTGKGLVAGTFATTQEDADAHIKNWDGCRGALRAAGGQACQQCLHNPTRG